MILIGDTKYACIECIRGHRSSQCRHHNRPLLLVRSKGRPNVHANGNPNHRVAVFAEKVDAGTDSEDSIEGVQCRNKNDPVIIVKASSKQILDLNSGKIVGPYNERDPEQNSRPPAPVISSDSFVNSASCCTARIKKPNKSCGCCGNKKKSNVDKSKILKKYLKNHFRNKSLEAGQDWTFVNHSPDPQISTTESMKTEEDSKDKVSIIPIPSCTIPGSCCCDDKCACVGCQVHGNTDQFTNEINKFINTELVFDGLNNESQYPISTNSLAYNTLFEPPDSLKSSSFAEIDTSVQPFSNGMEKINQELSHNSTESDYTRPELSEITYNPSNSKGGGIYSSVFKEEDSPNYMECVCPPDRCDCTNCETHGIINGLKLDDLFISKFDPKLLSLMSDINSPIAPLEDNYKAPDDTKKPRHCCSDAKAT